MKYLLSAYYTSDIVLITGYKNTVKQDSLCPHGPYNIKGENDTYKIVW